MQAVGFAKNKPHNIVGCVSIMHWRKLQELPHCDRKWTIHSTIDVLMKLASGEVICRNI